MATRTKALLMVSIDDDGKDDKNYGQDEKIMARMINIMAKMKKLWQG